MSIRLYAEFLLNIRQVTIYATLRSAPEQHLQAHVVSDRKTLEVTQDGETARIVFPSGIAGRASVDVPVDGRRGELSLRLEITEDDLDGKEPDGRGMAVANDTPWSAAALGPKLEMACRTCPAVLVPRKTVGEGGVREWRDLPRAHWAEAMDLWHCHKPPEAANGAPSRDGKYGALEKVARQGETGLVDACDFLIPERACTNLEVCPSPILHYLFVCRGAKGQKEGGMEQSSCYAMMAPPIQLPNIKG